MQAWSNGHWEWPDCEGSQIFLAGSWSRKLPVGLAYMQWGPCLCVHTNTHFGNYLTDLIYLFSHSSTGEISAASKIGVTSTCAMESFWLKALWEEDVCDVHYTSIISQVLSFIGFTALKCLELHVCGTDCTISRVCFCPLRLCRPQKIKRQISLLIFKRKKKLFGKIVLLCFSTKTFFSF